MSMITDLIMQQLGNGGVQRISQSLGMDEGTTGAAITAAVPLLVSAMARNAEQPEGADSLHQALNNDHDGSILENIGGFLGDPGAANGAGILSHVLGGETENVAQGLGNGFGLNAGQIGQLLITLAPLVMGVLGRTQREQGLDSQGLAGLLFGQRQEAQNSNPDLMGLIGGLLGGGGQGNTLGSVLGMAGKLFGRG